LKDVVMQEENLLNETMIIKEILLMTFVEYKWIEDDDILKDSKINKNQLD